MELKEKPQLSIYSIWNLCFGFLGIQMGFALQNTNTSRIFQYLGANTEDIAAYWLAAPVTGLIIQPIIGHFSDKTWTILGRRRIYFLVGAILSTICLLIMPNSPTLWIAIGTLWIMDASFNITMEPFRALVGDQLPRSQRALGFAMQSIFIGIGSVIASALPWILAKYFNVTNPDNAVIPPVVLYSFYIGAFVLFLSVLWTVFTVKEYSPEELEALEKADIKNENLSNDFLKGKKRKTISLNYFYFSLIAGISLILFIYIFSLKKELYVIGFMCLLFAILTFIAWKKEKAKETKGLILEIMQDLLNMPKTMVRLIYVQFFSWAGLYIMWIYSTPAVAFYHFNAENPQDPLYTEAGNWVGVLFGVYNLSAFFIAMIIPFMVRLWGLRRAHQINLLLGAVGYISIFLIKDPNLLIYPMILVGAAWASILSLPYAILSGSIPFKKMGIYMGIFNFFIVIPQICAGAVIGSVLVYLLGGVEVKTFFIAGGSLILAAFFTQFAKREV